MSTAEKWLQAAKFLNERNGTRCPRCGGFAPCEYSSTHGKSLIRRCWNCGWLRVLAHIAGFTADLSTDSGGEMADLSSAVASLSQVRS